MRATGLRMDLGEGREMSRVGGEPMGHMSGRVRGRKLRVRSTLRPREASCRGARGQPCSAERRWVKGLLLQLLRLVQLVWEVRGSVGKGTATNQRSSLTLFP
jgi:hypothetical protein